MQNSPIHHGRLMRNLFNLLFFKIVSTGIVLFSLLLTFSSFSYSQEFLSVELYAGYNHQTRNEICNSGPYYGRADFNYEQDGVINFYAWSERNQFVLNEIIRRPKSSVCAKIVATSKINGKFNDFSQFFGSAIAEPFRFFSLVKS